MQSATELTRATKPHSGIYATDTGYLFVPTEDMWTVHEASKPSAISARADLGRTWWYQVRREYGPDRHWLDEYFYSACALPADAGFKPTPTMLAFREEATIRSILAAARRPRKRMQIAWRRDYREQVTEALMSYWRRMYKAYGWFDRWLPRGGDLPAEVTVATVQQIRRCSRAWDFATLCRRIGCRADSTYVLWLRRGLIPDLGWLKWLFGAPSPKGSIPVGPALQRLRGEMGRKGILRAAGLNTATIWLWETDHRTSPSIKAILAGRSGADMEELPRRTQDQMKAVSEAASLEACCVRARLSLSGYYNAIKEAERCGVKDKLLQYLKIEGQFGTTKSRQSGLVADNFFVPTRDMLKFREEACREGAKQKVWSLANLPGFDAWFVDWTMPKPHRGRRHEVELGGTPEPVEEERIGDRVDNGHASRSITGSEDSARQEEQRVGSPTRETRRRPAREKYKVWKQWKAEGKSYGQIAGTGRRARASSSPGMQSSQA
jgi:hypothetical protein